MVGKSGVGQTKAKNDTAIHSEVRLTAIHNFLSALRHEKSDH